MNVSTPTGRCGPCCSIAATGSTATTLLMSAAAKSRQPISAQYFVGSIRFFSVASGLAGGDGLDFDFEFGAREPLHDHQCRSRRGGAHKFIPHFHVSAQIFGGADVGIDPYDVGERHSGLAQDRRDRAKTQARLGLDGVGNYAVSPDAQLPRAKDEPSSRTDFDAVSVIGEGRMDGTRIQRAHREPVSDKASKSRLTLAAGRGKIDPGACWGRNSLPALTERGGGGGGRAPLPQASRALNRGAEEPHPGPSP